MYLVELAFLLLYDKDLIMSCLGGFARDIALTSHSIHQSITVEYLFFQHLS